MMMMMKNLTMTKSDHGDILSVMNMVGFHHNDDDVDDQDKDDDNDDGDDDDNDEGFDGGV